MSITLDPVIFLDTNAVHYARLILAFGKKHSLNVQTEPFDKFKTELQSQGVGNSTIEKFGDGFWTVRYLQKHSSSGGRSSYSPITTVELFCNTLRAAALLQAAEREVPCRWFSMFEEREIRGHLGNIEYSEAASKMTDLLTLFHDAGVSIEEAKLDYEVWAMTRAIVGTVFVEAQDALVYASAIIQQAQEIVTSDGYLGETACYAHNPGGAPGELSPLFGAVNAALLAKFSELTGITTPDPILPVRRSFKEMKAALAPKTT